MLINTKYFKQFITIKFLPKKKKKKKIKKIYKNKIFKKKKKKKVYIYIYIYNIIK